ncbi:agmatine deiminase family protein [Candidatus Albibeggiatoa sp. nov. BB20]|uniref:agmatine deiminase family protein n=1 Tax=Candidatus Albibeggiatoa sp. nov. BB20 TaxID=3162723 RepID=UPI003365824A
MEIKNQLIKDSGWNNIAIIDELEGDTTGHADGMVSFIDTNVLALSDLGDKAMNAKYKNSLQTQLGPEINVVVVPSAYNPTKWRGFTSACGAHVNSLVNDKYVYMPLFFDDPENTEIDKDIFSLFKDNTKKTVVPISVPHVICRMGGNLRCLSWQVEGQIADKLVAAAASAYDSMFK